MQMVRYAGLYARNVKRKVAPAVYAVSSLGQSHS